MSRFKDKSDIPETVDVIASGYEWTCLICERLYHEIAWKDKVTCTRCHREFEAAAPEHAYD